jgi:long-chain acyl-CoA synthetase
VAGEGGLLSQPPKFKGMEHMDKNDTWPKLLAHNFRIYGDKHKAMRYKHYGIWRSYTWKDYYLETKYLALGLLSLGFKPKDRLLIVGDNAPEWYYAELAAQTNRGIAVGAYADLTIDELCYVASLVHPSLAVVEDQEQVDKLLESRENLPELKKIVYWNYKGLSSYSDPLLIGYREVIDLGKKTESQKPDLFEKNIEAGKADDVCAFVFTAGTTGSHPKAAMHTFASLRAGADSYLSLSPWYASDDFVPYLTPAWIHGQWTAIGCHLLSACTLDFAEKPETQQRDAKEIEPTIALFGARVWESQAAGMQARLHGARALKKLALKVFMPFSKKWTDCLINDTTKSFSTRVMYALSNFLIFRLIRKSIGLSRARLCYSTDGLLSPEAFEFFHGLSIPINFIYATTEAGMIAGSKNDFVRPDMVGKPFTGSEIKIVDGGEIAFRHDGIFLGYVNNPEETQKVLKDGWFYTKDMGSLDNNSYLRVVDRAGSIIRLSSGETLSPQSVECRLRFSPNIRDAWVFSGPDNSWISAAIIINYDNVSGWAGQRRLSFNSFAELSRLPEVCELIKQDIERINKTLPAGLRIKTFVNLNREFDPDQGEMTRTRNLKRSQIEENFKQVIDSIYTVKNQSQTGAQDPSLTVISVGGA